LSLTSATAIQACLAISSPRQSIASSRSHKKWQDDRKRIVAISQHIRSVSLNIRHPRVDDGERDGVIFNQRYDGDIVYQQACKLGCEGIVSKRLDSTYRSGRS
jgi:hypothetical protein